jgi:tetratricopeptide (TPR) repeat protein
MRKRVLSLVAVFASAPLEAAPAAWLEVKSPHFTVITNAGEKQGRRTAWQFEQIRSALVNLWPWAKIDSGRPFVVFAARDEATLKTLGPQYWEGKQFRPVSFGSQGRDRHFLALRTDIEEPDEHGANPYQSAYWSYTSAVFTRSFPRRLPSWYSRGMAEVMSNTIVRDKELHVGRPIAENVRRLRERAIPLNEFLAAEDRSRWLRQLEDAWLFDAQAWALVHYLLFGEKAANRVRLDRFNRLLYDGTASEVALREAFGDMKPYYDGMRLYVHRSLFSYVTIPVAVDTRLEAYATRALSAGEAAARRGEMLVAMNRPAEARAFAAEAAKADPTLPGPWEIEAELADADDHRDQARAAFAKAAEAGSRRAHVYYRLAQLEWVRDADKPRLERLASTLEKAREMEPGSADTLSFLADIRSDLGEHDEALALARKAVEIEPAESYHRVTLARALWNARQPEQAVQMARSALQAAESDSERQRAQSFLDFAARYSTPAPP